MFKFVKSFVLQNKLFLSMILMTILSLSLSKMSDYLDYYNKKKENYNLDQNNFISFVPRNEIPRTQKKSIIFVKTNDQIENAEYGDISQKIVDCFNNCATKSDYFSNNIGLNLFIKINNNIIESLSFSNCESQNQAICNMIFDKITKIISQCQQDFQKIPNIDKLSQSSNRLYVK